ncbi:MAG: DUF983 domain-containing protein [Pseudomonadota bacterium]
MENREFHPPLSPFATGMRARCPRCGEGPLFDGFITIAPRCPSCGLNFDFSDAGDGPAVFIILIVGFVIVGLALVTELAFRPAIWVHMVIWIPLTIGLALAMLRPLKAIMIALQFRHDAQEGRPE